MILLWKTSFERLGEGGGGLHKNVSQTSATINFSSGEIEGKCLSVRKNFIGNIKLGQTSHLNVNKFGIGNDRHRSHKL